MSITQRGSLEPTNPVFNKPKPKMQMTAQTLRLDYFIYIVSIWPMSKRESRIIITYSGYYGTVVPIS